MTIKAIRDNISPGAIKFLFCLKFRTRTKQNKTKQNVFFVTKLLVIADATAFLT